MKEKKFVKSQKELADVLGIDISNLKAHWLKKPDFPERVSQGYDVVACLSFVRAYKQAKEKATGQNRDLKQLKIQLECDILKEKLNILRGNVMTLQDVCDNITEFAQMVEAGLQELIQWVTVEYRDPAMLKKTKEIVERLKTQWRSKLNDARKAAEDAGQSVSGND